MRAFVIRTAVFIHHHFLALLLCSYVAAVLYPQWGQSLRLIRIAQVHIPGATPLSITLPLLMLSFLLFNAGLGIRLTELKALRQNPLPMILGLVTNLLLPVLFVWVLSRPLIHWHSPTEVQNILVGLALVAAMPIAGSSTAWSQNINGNMTLSLGLVVFSTMLSPFTTPLVLKIFGFMTTGDYSEDLMELGRTGADVFLIFSVVLPSLLGMATLFLLGENRLARVKPYLKLFNLLNLIVLSYSNAAVSLPQALHHPDWDFLTLIAAITFSLCFLAFGLGWALSRLLQTTRAEQVALMFGLGMNNNGTGLVLSSLMLADHPMVMLPIIFYNLAQQIVAGLVDARFATHQSKI